MATQDGLGVFIPFDLEYAVHVGVESHVHAADTGEQGAVS